jgi:transposase
VRVFEGNTKDNKTVADQVCLLATTFGAKDVVFVGDRGMIKSAQISNITGEKFNYITAITKPQIEKLIREGTFQLELFEDEICEAEENGIRYVLRRNPIRAEEVEKNRQGKFAKLKEKLEEKNEYLLEHARAKVGVAKKNVSAIVKKYKFHDWIKVRSKRRVLRLDIDEEARDQKYRLDGCYAIKTDLVGEGVKAESIHARYKDLAKVERAFRTMKTGYLEVRPIFVRKDDRTRGHVFVVMLAYLLEKEIESHWKNLEVTVAEGIDELGSIRATEIEIGNVKCQKVPEPVGLTKRLLESAGVRLPNVAPAKKVHVATRKKLVSERNFK